MDLANIPLFQALSRKMSWLTARQAVLAHNVANLDTPNYQASDLRPLDFRTTLGATALGNATGRLQAATTDPKHFSGSLPSAQTVDLVKTSDDKSINGNSVSVEDEMMKVSQTANDYQLMTNLYKKQLGMLKTAIGRAPGT